MKHVFGTILALSALTAGGSSPSFASPSSGSVSNYGAVGDGVTNDTDAFNACLTYNTICWVDPAKVYAVADVELKNGNRLIGLGVQEYGDRTVSTTASRPALVAYAGATAVLDVRGVTDGAAIEGLFIDCNNPSVNGISGGSFSLTVQDTTVVRCGFGFGGGGYTGLTRVINSTFGGNTTGMADFVDSFVANADFANNTGNGIYLGSGANSNTIVNSRFEWNQGFGIETFGGVESINISNSIFDRNYEGGIKLNGARGWSIADSTFNRNARNNAWEQNSQIQIENSTNISITGGLSLVGADDGGGGAVTPEYVFGYNWTSNTNITIAGFVTGGLYSASTNPAGSYTVAPVVGTEPTVGYNVSGVNDIPDTSRAVTRITAYAAGGQGSATQLGATVNTVSTAASTVASVRLQRCVPGRQQTVANLGANSIQVYGTSPDTINGAATGTGIAHPTNRIATYICTGNGNWTRLLSN